MSRSFHNRQLEDDDRFTGQVAFITGGELNGKATAKRLAEAGMKVAICARRADSWNGRWQNCG